jgi:hypothetical protein
MDLGGMGKRVPAAPQARAAGQNGPAVTIGENFVVREEADSDKPAREITRQINKAILHLRIDL